MVKVDRVRETQEKQAQENKQKLHSPWSTNYGLIFVQKWNYDAK